MANNVKNSQYIINIKVARKNKSKVLLKNLQLSLVKYIYLLSTKKGEKENIEI